jgi:DNA-directed RNA polymerase specialized sigma subunit
MDAKARTLELLIEYQRCPSPRLRNQIATLNLGLVRKAAQALSKDGRETYDDLVQVGSIGLLKAIDRFEPSRGIAFSSLAMPHIRGEISHWRRDRGYTIRPPRAWWDKFSRIRRLLESGATLEEIAAQTRIPLGELPAAISAMNRPDAASLDAPLADTESNYEPPANNIVYLQWENEMAININRRQDGLIDATAICQHYNRRFSQYWRRRGKRYLDSLRTQKVRCHPDTFAEVRPGAGGRAWVCDEIALDLLRWCDSAMCYKLDEIVVQRITA